MVKIADGAADTKSLQNQWKGRLLAPKGSLRATLPHAATQWEPPGLIPKGWGVQSSSGVSTVIRKIAIGLVAAAIATADSTLSASAFREVRR